MEVKLPLKQQQFHSFTLLDQLVTWEIDKEFLLMCWKKVQSHCYFKLKVTSQFYGN